MHHEAQDQLRENAKIQEILDQSESKRDGQDSNPVGSSKFDTVLLHRMRMTLDLWIVLISRYAKEWRSKKRSCLTRNSKFVENWKDLEITEKVLVQIEKIIQK